MDETELEIHRTTCIEIFHISPPKTTDRGGFHRSTVSFIYFCGEKAFGCREHDWFRMSEDDMVDTNFLCRFVEA